MTEHSLPERVTLNRVTTAAYLWPQDHFTRGIPEAHPAMWLTDRGEFVTVERINARADSPYVAAAFGHNADGQLAYVYSNVSAELVDDIGPKVAAEIVVRDLRRQIEIGPDE